jgi:hypothetical protein
MRTNFHSTSLQPNAGFLCACKKIVDSKSVDFLLRYCNMAVFKQAINKFPADIHEARGKMIIEIIEQSTGKAVPGQIKKIATNRKEEAEQTLNYYREMCDYLRLWGAMISLVRAEYLLPFHLFEKIILDNKSPEAGVSRRRIILWHVRARTQDYARACVRACERVFESE